MKKGLFRLQYEIDDAPAYTERGSREGAKLASGSIADPEVISALKATADMGTRELMRWVGTPGNLTDGMAVLPLTTRTPEALSYRLDGKRPKLLYVLRPLHTIESLDGFLYAANVAMADGGCMVCHSMTSALKRKLIDERNVWGVRHLLALTNYLWHRVCPKLKLTHGLYFALTDGKDRWFNRVEVLGRIYRAGFEVIDEGFRQGEFVVVARKVQAPIDDVAPTGSPIIHLRRIGLGGKEIVVHKFRTMYSYSEYIQDYIYHYQSLERGGKFKDDYRVNEAGHLLRRLWLDELPMVWNMLRGDMKLVGVRPLSRQYFGLYTPEMQALRTRTKPGLLPPFYYDRHTPETIEEVQQSERRYLEAYLEHPFRTDWRYFWGIVGNIMFHRKHSA